MHIKTRRAMTALVVCSTIVTGNAAHGVCPGALMQGKNSCLYHPDFSTVAGDLLSDNHRLLASNMYPFQRRGTADDLAFWYSRALDDLSAGKGFREDLLLIDAVPDDGTPLGDLLADPKLNYETAGLLKDLALVEARLVSARDTFAYLFFLGYPDPDSARIQLLDSIKTLASLNLMIADEFLIDALEWRFSSDTLGLDAKLDEQITLLERARIYYEAALGVFLHGFSPAVGTNIYVADYFDDAVYSLFRLAVERMSLALREKSSRQLVRQMSPDPTQTWEAARQDSLATLKSINVLAYLSTAAIASKQGANFDAAGAGSSLVGALLRLRHQGNIYNQRLNPLGYNNRYVPMTDFSDLYGLAMSGLGAAQAAQNAFDAEKREFDTNLQALRQQVLSLTSNYGDQLRSLTGCALPSDPEDPDQIQAFLICTGEAGPDLFDCSLDLDAAAFEGCVAGSKTAGVLAQKYRNIRIAQTRVAAAVLRRDNILKRIELENEKSGKIIALKRSFSGAQSVLLDQYLEKLKKARTITDTRTEGKDRYWSGPPDYEWKLQSRTRGHVTKTTFAVKDESLQLNTKKEKELLEITTDFEIQQVNIQTAYLIEDLLLSAAEVEIEIQLAIQQKSSALADFDNSLQHKESHWFLYQRARNQLRYYTERTASLRVLKSQAAIRLADRLNYTAHYAYLASKALEYQHLTPLDDEPVGSGNLRITDLFKAQTPGDMEDFLLNLNAFATTKCPWGTFDPQYPALSLAYDILGLWDEYLDPDGDGLAEGGKSIKQARREAVQSFVGEHLNEEGNLEFAFTISEDASLFAGSQRYNQKLWSGSAPSGCDALVTPVIGTTINLLTTQSAKIKPKIRLRQSGHSSLRDAFGDVVEYIPVGDFHFLFQGGDQYLPFKEAEFNAFVNADDPRTESGGTWTGAFKGRSVSSSDWNLELFDGRVVPPVVEIDLSKIEDIQVHLDTIGECCY